MNFKDIFKKKKKSAPSDFAKASRGKLAKKPKAIKEDKPVQKTEIAKPSKGKIVKPAKRIRKGVSKIAPGTLVFPRITEKAMALAEQNQYVFKVFKSANKIEVKKAINEIYGVAVEKIRIVNIPRKQRRLGKIKGWKQGYKKAIVTVKQGQKIDIV